jgi:hypothetical protein
MGKLTWVGCVVLTVAVAPVQGAEESVEVLIRGRLHYGAGTGPTTVTVGQGETARTFTLPLPSDPALREAARGLDGKAVRVNAVWERKVVVLSGSLRPTPRVQVVLINGVKKTVPISYSAHWEVQKKVVELMRVKSILPADRPCAELTKPAEDTRKGKP